MMENREDAEVGKGREADEKEGGEGCKDQVGKYTCVCVCACVRSRSCWPLLLLLF